MLAQILAGSELSAPGRTQVQKFRHRGFKPNDGGPIVMQFENGPEPVNNDGSKMEELWDNDIEQVIFVKKHVDEVVVPVETPKVPPI